MHSNHVCHEVILTQLVFIKHYKTAAHFSCATASSPPSVNVCICNTNHWMLLKFLTLTFNEDQHVFQIVNTLVVEYK